MTVNRETHSRSVPGGREFWWSDRLWAESVGLPVMSVPIADIAEFDQSCWFGDAPPTCREVAEHARRIEAADLRHPVILNADGGQEPWRPPRRSSLARWTHRGQRGPVRS